MNYVVFFDAADSFVPALLPFAAAFVVATVTACLIGALLVRHELRRQAITGTRARMRVLALIAGLFVVVAVSMIVVMLTGLSSVGSEGTARAIESSPVVEGVVEHFHPMPPGGHDTERFDVAGVHFEYSHWSVSQGFNQDITVGGPIREGSYVRIHYVHLAGESYGTIVRLELRQ